ncbi:MAG: hypothetical protein P0Y49_15700 [Candidatus Pedobacter colombiensis]|uniref:Uncharacterized protein n=1 Tax=Candidatus Pedobacter colombiensis TaxID=3121371 RepID=A0AAJ5W6X2_9SPHI|nr:hypothetical protein [Pedobacter sp.]WEK18235.1 MAG: hypothetical protein P0Y49_15700 [Pedobacter sp.]
MQIKQKWSSHLIRFMVLALSAWCFHSTDVKAQFIGNPLIPKEGKVIIYTNDAKGGHHQVATVAERNNISADRRQPGMLCTVMDDGTGKAKTFQLICKDLPAELNDNNNWIAFSPGTPAAGNNLIYGAAVPDASTGKAGDFFIHTATQTLYGPKQADNSWPVLLLQGIPSGSAGGDLTGTYPNPSITEKAVTVEKINPGTADQVLMTDADGKVTWVDKANLGTGGGGTIGNFNGNRPITGDYYKNVNPGTDDLAKWIEAVFYPSVGPSASLTATPNGVKEMGPAGSTTVSLAWTATRAAATEEITEIIVNGTNVFTGSPAAGASVNGTQSASATNNVKTTFTMSVKTSDNKTASSSASLEFQWKRYWGFASGGEDGVPFAPTDAQILALSGSELATSAVVSNKSAAPSGRQKLVIAYPASWGGSKIIVGVNDSTGAFEKTTRSFTNAAGGTTSYVIYVQKDNTAAGLTFSVQ